MFSRELVTCLHKVFLLVKQTLIRFPDTSFIKPRCTLHCRHMGGGG